MGKFWLVVLFSSFRIAAVILRKTPPKLWNEVEPPRPDNVRSFATFSWWWTSLEVSILLMGCLKGGNGETDFLATEQDETSSFQKIGRWSVGVLCVPNLSAKTTQIKRIVIHLLKNTQFLQKSRPLLLNHWPGKGEGHVSSSRGRQMSLQH